MMTDPIKQIAQPSFPSVPSSSLRKYDPRTAPINTLSAPNGVTKIAGANAYAAKLATSPRTTIHVVRNRKIQHSKDHTRNYASPPYWTLKICEPFSFKPEMLFCVHQTLGRVSIWAVKWIFLGNKFAGSVAYHLRNNKTCA